MSNVNIRRAVGNIRRNTTVYMPVVETIVNAVQAIDELGGAGGRVSVRALRGTQGKLDARHLREHYWVRQQDNGIRNFNAAPRQSVPLRP